MKGLSAPAVLFGLAALSTVASAASLEVGPPLPQHLRDTGLYAAGSSPAADALPMYKHMTDADLDAVFSYLRTIPAIRNAVPEPLPPLSVSNTMEESTAARR
jgi:hypothetical protein